MHSRVSAILSMASALALGVSCNAAIAQVAGAPPPPTIPAAPVTPATPTAPVAPAASPAPQTPSAVAPVTAPVSLADGYVLGPGDMMDVSVLGRAEFSPRVQVQTDGTILLPYIGSLRAVNRTVLQLRDDVRKALKDGGYYADPTVAVNVVSFASRYIIALGEVSQPGIVPVDRAYRVSEILARIGGTKSSAVDELTLTRTNGQVFHLFVSELATGGPDKDPFVNPGDKLYAAPAKTFYIYGQISAPGVHPVGRNMDLRKAIASCGGLTPMGSEKRIKVIRAGKEIRKFKMDDPILDEDVIVVGERFF